MQANRARKHLFCPNLRPLGFADLLEQPVAPQGSPPIPTFPRLRSNLCGVDFPDSGKGGTLKA